MRESAALARSYRGRFGANGVRLHTHLAENDHDVAFSLETFGRSPIDYMSDVDWLGDDVWHAHCVKLDDDGILDMWLQLWRLPCGQYHGSVLLPAVHVQLVGLDRSLGRLAQHCGPVVRLPE
jgi:hypothetical protein